MSLLLAGWQWLSFTDSQNEARDQAKPEAIEATMESAADVNELLNSIASQVDDLAERLNKGHRQDALEDRIGSVAGWDSCASPRGATDFELDLCSAASAVPEINGIGVIFDPQHDPETSYRPYANRIRGSLLLGELTLRNPLTTDWWLGAAEKGEGVWTHPRFGTTSRTLLAIYSAPFYANDGSLRGVLIASYTLDQLADDMRWLKVGATGYSIMLSEQGKLLSHPESIRVDNALAEDPEPAAGLVSELQDAVADSSGSGFLAGRFDDVTEADAWLVYEPVEETGWTYGAVVIEEELLSRTAGQTRSLIILALSLLAAFFFALIVSFGVHRGNPRGQWALSIATGVLALVGIAAVWQLTLSGPRPPSSPKETSLSKGAETLEGEPTFAGLFVQSIEFTGANDVTVSGIAWQQRRDDAGAEPPGFVLPEADEVTLDEQYLDTTENLTRKGWAFTASLRQTFEYSRYPLDRETVWLRLWSADYDNSEPLLPDLTSYESLAPTTRPGIEQDFVLEGWTVDSSSFSYRLNEYNTSFGEVDITGGPRAELYFNVHLKRSFLDALMSQLVPLTVVAILLFGVLLATTEGRIKGENLGFTTLGVLAYCAALFFVVIVSHNELRSELQAQEVIYLEYFYFAAYLAILGVSANAILVGASRGGRFIEYRDNVIPSLLFWPVLNTALLVITVIAFF